MQVSDVIYLNIMETVNLCHSAANDVVLFTIQKISYSAPRSIALNSIDICNKISSSEIKAEICFINKKLDTK